MKCSAFFYSGLIPPSDVGAARVPQSLPLQAPAADKVSPSQYEAIAVLDFEENEEEKWAGIKFFCLGRYCIVKYAHLSIEKGLEHAPFVVLVYFFSSFEHAKKPADMGPNNTKNSSLKVCFPNI